MVTQTDKKSYVQPQENWRQQYDAVTHNDVIDAYLKGKQAGKDEAKLAMIKLFESNLSKAQQKSEELYSKFKEMGLSLNSIHLKADTLTTFMALIVADVNDYVSERFVEAITLSRELKQQTDTVDFNINFYFTYHADTLNESCLDADGYFLKYNGHED